MLINSFLGPWLEGKYSMPNLSSLNSAKPNLSLLWLGINYCIPFYKVADSDQKVLGFNEAWEANRNYYESAIEIALDYDGHNLDHEDAYDILEKLGPPPNVSHPIYIVTVRNELTERVVYVGKSSSNLSRFTGGHIAALKLLNPVYDGFEKLIYFGQIMTWSDEHDYLPLEFIGDRPFSEKLLDDVESVLIQHYKPELNKQKMQGVIIANDFSLSVTDYFSNKTLFNISL